MEEALFTTQLWIQHLNVLYVLFTGIVGILSLGIIGVLYAKNRAPLLRYYAYFSLSLGSMVNIGILQLYSYLNIMHSPPPDTAPVRLTFFFQTCALHAVMLTLPMFMHHLCEHPQSRRRNRILALILVAAFSGRHLAKWLLPRESAPWIDPVERTLFAGILLYAIVLARRGAETLHDPLRRITARTMLRLQGIFFPGLIIDMFLWRYVPIRFFPLFSCLLNAALTYRFLKNYFHAPQATGDKPGSPTAPLSLAEQWAPYHITTREQEIIALLQQGYSNPQIAEALYISLSTVKTHLRNIFQKLDIKSRYELIARFKNVLPTPNLPE